jgi:glycosyltransferase involved in cell wall biosynthesis
MVPEDNPAAFALEVVDVLRNEDLRACLAREGRAYANEWSDQTLAGRMADLYRSIHQTQQSAA